jgi:hypothetical protein
MWAIQMKTVALLQHAFKSLFVCLFQTLEDLDYADDICLLSHSQAHMQSKLNNLCYGSKKAGLEINFSKSSE